MPDRALWMPSSDIQAVFEHLVVSPGQTSPVSLEVRGQAALALALAYGVSDPNAALEGSVPNECCPLLHSALRGLATQNAQGFSDNAVRAWGPASSDPADPLPLHWAAVAARERLAVWLVQQGADPWTKDSDGMDALDWAVAAQARSLFHALMGHPARPPLETLRARTSRRVGREVPWLHALAYFNGTAMFEDLVKSGWDPMGLDKNGWPAPAWANAPATLRALLEKHTDAEIAQMHPALEKAWFRRKTQGLTDNHFDIDKLKETLEEFARLSEQDKADIQIFNLAAACLAANPSKLSHHYKGVRWTSLTQQTQDATRWMAERFDWRKTEKNGAAKGVWSLAAACVWGAVRGEEKFEAEKNLSEALAKVLGEQPEDKRNAWLDEEIRPGVSNRGLLAWGVGGYADGAFRALLTPGADGADAVRIRLEAATRLVETWWSGTSSREWSDALSRGWHKLAEADEIWAARELDSYVVGAVQALVRCGLFRPTPSVYRGVIGHAQSQAELGTEAGWRKAFDIATALLPMSPVCVPGVSSWDIRHKTAWDGLVRLRKQLSETLEAALRAHPKWAVETAAAPFLFEKRAKDETQLPSPVQWEAFLKECALEASLGAETAPRPGARRPRM